MSFMASQQIIEKINTQPNPGMLSPLSYVVYNPQYFSTTIDVAGKKLVMITAEEEGELNMQQQEAEFTLLSSAYADATHLTADCNHFIPYHRPKIILDAIKLIIA